MSTNAPIPATPAAAARSATPTIPLPASTDTTLLPDDPTVLKQMIAELLRELRRERRDREGVQQRLDALLRRLYGPRPTPDNPQQPSLFPDLNSDTAVSPEPPPPQTLPRLARPPIDAAKASRMDDGNHRTTCVANSDVTN